jgi:uncharacterized protein (DUF1697 family)
VPKYAAFLRAINIGGRRITNNELRTSFEELGFSEVAVWRASGNVIFETDARSPARLSKRIDEGLSKALGYEVVTYLRTADEVRAIAEHEPFDPTHVRASKGKLQLALLADRPSTSARRKVLAMATDDDRLAFGARELYWLPSGGFAESELDRNLLAKALGPITFRTKNVLEEIARKHFAA